ncbi:glycoside hydrolase 43 family protein [Pelagicoccus sp. SDUM812003]|uniref:glycoside hydrolase family 43 protein n=1 Tax=Pelagicoccus sp. SDUM812003 TaxID=3041267 RepID=UPI00280EB20D|nr:glycoside hydrolase 43 family protein [Pelagicoccus sp. SDUM812003]MDQ8201734.1 glycoside hydrolase 43 family protein [Pelagicoccus sp. SDUM812003]
MTPRPRSCFLACPLFAAALLVGLATAAPWQPDLGDGTYRNPVIYADYSDPDVVKVGEDFYMTASSFNCVPGLPILHSKDLVNWELVNYAIPRFPDAYFDVPQHGNGVWAPSFRYHEGVFHIYWGDPDRGIFRVSATDPRGEWSAPILVKDARGNIDACPLWDDDGRVYLVHAFANSRAGLGDVLQVQEMTPEGDEVIRNRKIVFNGHGIHPTLEGPKFYKRNGYYYIFAPGGGVATGWQVVLRSKNVFGPYEDRIALSTGETEINGPHQGGYVELDNGEGWFVHFQEVQPYGRIVHLQPVHWVDDWPVMGEDPDGDGNGQPIARHAKPSTPTASAPTQPQVGDEFDEQELSLAWQWHANWRRHWWSLSDEPGSLSLRSQWIPALPANLWNAPHLLLQKLPAPAFTATAKIDASGLLDGERSGLVMMGMDYALLAVERDGDAFQLVYSTCEDARRQNPETRDASAPLVSARAFLQVEMMPGGLCQFRYSEDGETFVDIGAPFQAVEGRWIGAKVGLVSLKPSQVGAYGQANYDYFRIE